MEHTRLSSCMVVVNSKKGSNDKQFIVYPVAITMIIKTRFEEEGADTLALESHDDFRHRLSFTSVCCPDLLESSKRTGVSFTPIVYA